MHQELEIDMAIWEYLDGVCTEDARQHTEALIHSDPVWKKKYEEALQLQASLHTGMDMEHTSMRFTKNVMEAVANTSVAPKAKSYVNVWIIRGIAAFFLLIIGGTLVEAFSSIEWTSSSSPSWVDLRLDRITIPSASHMLYTFLALTIVAGLALLDVLLKRKNANMTS